MLTRFMLCLFLLGAGVPILAQATVNEVDPAANRATGNGSTKIFPYSFTIRVKTDIQVYIDTTVKTVDTHYTVSGLGVDGGGNITFLTAPPNGSVVTFLRKQPASQLSVYNPNEAFPAKRIERDYDKLVMQLQQAKEKAARSYHLPLQELGTEALTTVPTLSLRASKYMGWDASGNITALAASSGSSGTGDLTDVTAGAGIAIASPSGPMPTVSWDASTFVSNLTFWDGANASRTLTAGLSGASDPVLTFSDGIIDLTTGVFKQGGVVLDTISAANILSNKTLAAPIITGTITLPDGVKQTFNPDAILAGLNVGSQAGLVATPANGDIWYDSTGNKYKCRENGVTVDCINTAAGSGDVTSVVAGAGVTVASSTGPDPVVTWAPNTQVNSLSFFDGSQATRTLTIDLSGTDPVWTYGSSSVDLTTGTLKQGGVNVATISTAQNLTTKTLTAPIFSGSLTGTASFDGTFTYTTPIIAGAITFPDGVKQTFNPDATLSGFNVGAQAGDVATPANGDIWYDSTANKYRCRENGATVDCLSTGAGTGDVTDVNAGAGIAVSSSGGPAPTVSWSPATQVASFTLFDSANASRTITFGLSGATDPVWTAGNASMDLTTGTLKQGGVDVLTSSSTHTVTNKTYDAEGTGNVLTITRRLWFPAAGCDGVTAGSVWDLPTTNAAIPACVTGANVTQKGVLNFTDGSNLSAQTSYKLPSTWTGTVDATILWLSATTSGDVVWQLATICVADNESDDPAAFNTATLLTDTTKGTANRLNSVSVSTVTVTGCAAGELMHIEIRRDSGHVSDTMAGTARLVGVELVVREAL